MGLVRISAGEGRCVLNRIRRCTAVVFVSALLPIVVGVAGADPVTQEKGTVDGFHMKISIEDVNIQSVPNMAAAPLVREGFITATTKLEVTCPNGACPQSAVTTLSMQAQVGCQTDLSSGATIASNPNVSSSIPVLGILGAILPPPTPAPTPGPTDLADIALQPTGQITPSVSVTLFPGYIRNVQLGDMQYPMKDALFSQLKTAVDLAGKASNLKPPSSEASKIPGQPGFASPTQLPAAPPSPPLSESQRQVTKRAEAVLNQTISDPLVVSVQNLHLEVDQVENSLAICGGAVAVRIYAAAQLKTATSLDRIDIYGDIVPL